MRLVPFCEVSLQTFVLVTLLTKSFTIPNLVINSSLRCPRKIAHFRMAATGTLEIGSEYWVERQAAQAPGICYWATRFDAKV